MQPLLTTAGAIAVLWLAYWLLTRPRLPVRRHWSWGRLYIRTFDKLLTDPANQGIFAIILWAPVILYIAASELFGVTRTMLGWLGACSITVMIGFLAVRRAAKWMGRASRPADKARARLHQRILSREYRIRRRSKRRS